MRWGQAAASPIPTQDVLLQTGDAPGAICFAKPFFFLSALDTDGDCLSELAPALKLYVKKKINGSGCSPGFWRN